MRALRSRWRGLVGGLWFLPLLVAVVIGGAAFGVVQLDEHVVGSPAWVFGGGPVAARTVLTTIAGSLITVAGLTFSVTMIVLQLASSQFSPRVVPTVLGDRLTQLTVGTYVGIFIFCLVGLRTVGGEAEFVPRLTVTTASALGVAAVILLVVFIHHVSTMIQVSHVAARIARSTTAALDRLYPEAFADAVDDGSELLAAVALQPSTQIPPNRPGYVRAIDLDSVARCFGRDAALVHVRVAPGDFASSGTPVLEVWPPLPDEAAARAADVVQIADERDLEQDTSFGVRQLTDVALRAISPGVNDPTTAVTCVGYIRSVLESIVGRAFPPGRRAAADDEPIVVARSVDYAEYLDSLVEIGRHARGDARVVRQVLRACAGVHAVAVEAGADERARLTLEAARTVAEQALGERLGRHDRELVEEMLDRVERGVRD